MKKLILLVFTLLIFAVSQTGNVSAQTCTTTPPTTTGRVTLSADTTTTGGNTYRVWSRIKAPDTTNNSFYLQVDGGCAILVGNSNSIPANTWTWVNYKDGNTSSFIDVSLSAGSHTITIIGNEPGVGVDKLLMTKNLSCVPTGMSGDNCPAEVNVSPTAGSTDTTPPTISNATATSITNTSANIEWNLSEGATGQVDYGTTTSYGSSSPVETDYLTFHRQSLSGLTPNTVYNYRIKSRDQAGNLTTSTNFTFRTTGGTSPTPTATLTPTKTPTPLPNSTLLRFNSVKLHGIGRGGDNTNPNLNGNLTPLRTSRALNVELIDSNGNSIPGVSGNVTYKSATGDFSGDIVIDPSVASGSYLVKVKSPGFLKKQLIGIITITKSATNTAPNVTLVTGDSNNDNSLTILDYNIIIDCYSDLLEAKNCSDSNKKASADLSDDGNVNADDYNLFLRELSVVSGD